MLPPPLPPAPPQPPLTTGSLRPRWASGAAVAVAALVVVFVVFAAWAVATVDPDDTAPATPTTGELDEFLTPEALESLPEEIARGQFPTATDAQIACYAAYIQESTDSPRSTIGTPTERSQVEPIVDAIVTCFPPEVLATSYAERVLNISDEQTECLATGFAEFDIATWREWLIANELFAIDDFPVAVTDAYRACGL